MDSMRNTFIKLRWRLTLSYTAVTVSSLFLVVLISGFLLFSKVLVPLEILNSVMTPSAWIDAVRENASPEWQYILSQEPIDTRLISMMLQDGDLQVTYFDLFRIGDLQIRLRTIGQGSVLLVDPDGILLGTSNPDFAPEESIGRPLDTGILPGLEEPLKTALRGEFDADRLFVTIEPNERFYFAIPYLDEVDQEVLGVGIVYIESLPTENDIPANTMTLLGRSVLILLVAAGLIGTVFGFLTARGMVRRLQRVSEVADAWSQGDFSEFIDDPVGDEISQLGQRLNRTASQLKDLLKRRQEMAVSEERNRLARDLHDSAKQQALAASFQIGTTLTLFERDPQIAKGHLEEAERLVDSVRAELTDLILELRPQALDEKLIDEVLGEYALDWSHQNHIEVNLDLQAGLEVSLDVKQTLLRILQESLANAARHSAGECVSLTLGSDGQVVNLVIKDDGKGFDLDEVKSGMGLLSMRERAESLGGGLVVTSASGEGTSISVVIPQDQ